MRVRHSAPAWVGSARLLVATAALYALLLQAFLGALAPLPSPGFCAPAETHHGDAAHVHDGACCLAACRTPLAPPPEIALASPPPAAIVLVPSRPDPAPRPAARHPGAPGARGPPEA